MPRRALARRAHARTLEGPAARKHGCADARLHGGDLADRYDSAAARRRGKLMAPGDSRASGSSGRARARCRGEWPSAGWIPDCGTVSISAANGRQRGEWPSAGRVAVGAV